ncbi:ABC transporter ATP-binding protein [Leucobacter rhizosphaerae]|uniref:ABC transporter ATP-binding protein n=1 Tax=Leucobacter rhizosphaerae TaxID=2932245 RepID=A0ABY4FUW0_9MICO|nr:ABC transporter ATP-binding protein [Leucobacter rhizosphaerae]UOQ60093.1 ABC transporter ATP-binding protein [Leucobacter rhizosphaerae]
MSSVTLDSVSLAYPGGQLGLADVDLTIADGEFIALVGPSGSGKTTLLRTVAGFVAPTAGRVRIGDAVVSEPGRSVEPERRGLGMVFQQHAVWPHWNVGRNIAYPLRRAGVARAERARRVAEALELVGLPGAERRDPATLSGGQRQRVAIARAIVARPRVLLLDEALSALDEPLRDRLRLELRALTRSLGLTVLHVTHDRSEALALADRVVVLDGGRVQQVGAPADLLDRPASPFVARFISDATVLPGRLDRAGFHADGHPISIAADRLSASGHDPARTGAGGPADRAAVDLLAEMADEVDVAVQPEHVRVVPDPMGPATVTSSFFGRGGDELVVRWGDLQLRSRMGSLRCAVGTRVRVEIERAALFSSATDRTAAPGDALSARLPCVSQLGVRSGAVRRPASVGA